MQDLLEKCIDFCLETLKKDVNKWRDLSCLWIRKYNIIILGGRQVSQY